MTITVNAVTAKTVVNPWTGDRELLAVGAAHRGRDGDVVKDAFVRDPSDSRGELRVVNQLYHWVYHHPAELLVTHGGLKDLERVTQQAERRASVGGVKHRVREVRDVHVHHDLREEATPTPQHRESDNWRKSREPLVQELGERYLETGEKRIQNLLYGVTASDAEALLELHEELNEGKHDKTNEDTQSTRDQNQPAPTHH